MVSQQRTPIVVKIVGVMTVMSGLMSGAAWAAPTISITNPANGATVSGTITVTASASGFNTLTKVEFWLDGVSQVTDTAAPWSWSWNTATATTGAHSLSCRGYDATPKKWTTSTTLSVTVIRADATPPTGSVTINGGAAFTTTTATTLTLAASDPESGVTQMQFSNDNVTYSTADAYATTKSWALASGDGVKTVYAKFKNGQNLWSAAVNDTITLDATPPALPTINAPVTPTSQPTQTLAGTRAVDAVTITLSSTTATFGAVSYPTATTWQAAVTCAVGSNVIQARAADSLGNTSAPAQTTIVYDPTLDPNPPTGTISINSGAPYATSATVTLTLSATDQEGPVIQMRVSNDGVTYATPEAYATTKTWTLTSGDGAKTVYAQFKDQAGNWSVAASDAITLDATPPQVQITNPQDQQVLTGP